MTAQAHQTTLSGHFIEPGADLHEASLVSFDLTGADLTGADLTGANLTGADLTSATLTGATLTGATLTGSTLTGVISGSITGTPSALDSGFVLQNGYLIGPGVNLTSADLNGADLTGANLTGADLTGADLTGANLTGADFTGANLTGADLTGIDLTGANLTGADLTGADLTGTDLTGANLTGADLTGADLTGANLTGADLTGANLTGADLTGIDLTGANLTGATLTGVISGSITGTPSALDSGFVLQNGYLIGPGVNLTSADLNGADLTGANLTGADLTGANLSGVNLSEVSLSFAVLHGAITNSQTVLPDTLAEWQTLGINSEDTTAPVAPVVSIIASDNTLTADEAGGFSGISGMAEAAATIKLTADGLAPVEGLSTTADAATGLWSFSAAELGFDVDPKPTDATYDITITATDAAANVSEATSVGFIVALTDDTTAPVAPAINLIATDDVVSASEAVAGFAVTGTGEVGATLSLSLSSSTTLAGGNTTMVTSDGTWSLAVSSADIAAMGSGSEQITAVQTDVAGNTSNATAASLVVDIQGPVQDVVGGFNIEQLSKAGDVVTYGLIADASYDLGGDGIGALDIKTINFDPTEFGYVEGSLTSDHYGQLLIANGISASDGVVSGVAMGLTAFTDFSQPIAEFQMTVLDTSEPISISITGTLFDGDAAPDTIETFDYTSSTLTATVITRDDTAMDGVTITASDNSHTTDSSGQLSFEVSNGSDVVMDASFAIDDSATSAINSMDALQALRIAVGLDTSNGPATYEDFIAADIDGSGSVNSMDALNILKYAVGSGCA